MKTNHWEPLTQAQLAEAIAYDHKDWSQDRVSEETGRAWQDLQRANSRLRYNNRKFSRLQVQCGSMNHEEAYSIMAAVKCQERLRRDDWERSSRKPPPEKPGTET